MERLEDEQLVALVQECGHVPARDELISRCHGLKDRLIRRWAASNRLQEADRLDAQQDAVLWTLEAIRAYDSGQQARPRGCHFRSFLHLVLLARFTDLLRRRGRRQARVRLGGCAFGSLSSPPQREAEREELLARLHRELGRLGELAPELWGLLVRGVRLREAAAALGLSYDAAKRQRRKLIARLRACLGGG
jgi:RNA polymerase sigma factor (sigma-70 family)